MKYKAVLFDLDGTLLDTINDITDSMNIALREAGLEGHDSDTFKRFIGDGIEEFVERSLPDGNRTPELIQEIVTGMRAEYRSRWQNQTVPYPGIPQLLDNLSAQHIHLSVLSNKPDDFTKKMIRTLLSQWHFDPLLGARKDVPRKPDPAGALEIAQRLGVNPDECIYLGDSETDMIMAVSAGMLPVGVSWGFRTGNQLLGSGAEVVLDRPADLETLL
jgi:phosphoglycolate phosphatase